MSEQKPVAWRKPYDQEQQVEPYFVDAQDHEGWVSTIFTVPLYPASALTHLMQENERLKRELADADALIKAQQHDFAANNIRNAEDAARAKAAEQRVKDAVKVLGKQIKALQPLSNAVFNDNGAITVVIPYITSEHCIEAYFTERAARDFIKEVGE